MSAFIGKPEYKNEAPQSIDTADPGATPEAESVVTSKEAPQSIDINSPDATSKTDSAGASTDSVPQNGPEVNGNIDESSTQGMDGRKESVEGRHNFEAMGAASENFSGLRDYENLPTDDNVQPSRRNDARQEEYPKKDASGRDVSRFASNVGNSEAISDRDVDTLKKLIQDGLLGHETQSMEDVHKGAVDRIKEVGAAKVHRDVTKAVTEGSINEHLIAEAEVLFSYYSNRKGIMQSRPLRTF